MRLPREPSHPERLKGFGYAEFDDVDSLLRALSLSEEVRGCPKIFIFLFIIHLKLNKCCCCSRYQNLGSRRIRVDIADQSNDKGMFFFACHLAPLVLYSVTIIVLFF